MFLTEAQARDKDCPIVKGSCHGPDCMMWRWYLPPELDDNPVGYCGLASMPTSDAADLPTHPLSGPG